MTLECARATPVPDVLIKPYYYAFVVTDNKKSIIYIYLYLILMEGFI